MEIKNLQLNDEKLRDLYLKKLSLGEIQGPPNGKASQDKPWLKYYSDTAIISDVPEGLSVYEYMKSKNIANPNRIAINYFGRLYTYGDLFQIIDEYSSKYSNLGVKKGDIVSICMPSTPETVASFYALNKMGVVCDMIDPRSNPEQLEYYLKENNSKLLILCENYYKKLKLACDKSNLDHVILCPITPSAPLKVRFVVDTKVAFDNRGVKKSDNVMTWKEFKEIDSYYLSDTDLHPQDIAIIVHSSGTTSLPKGIVLTNRNLNALAFQYKLTSLKTDPGSKFLSVIPAFASFGMVASINLPFTLSMENILLPMVNGKIFIQNMKKNKISFTLTIPSSFVALSKYKGKDIDLSGLYGPGSGGYSLNSSEEKSVQDYLKENGCPVPMLKGWGMSELSSTACLELPECSKLLSSGIPLPKNVVSIFEPGTENELSYNEEGEVCVTGPTVMKCYLNNPEKTSKVLRKHSDGKVWLHSCDIGVMDSDGRVTIVNRLERMIIKGIDGFKIFPQKIEEVIATASFVESCVVVGYNTDKSGIVPKAYIVLKEEYQNNPEAAIEEIKKICLAKLSVRAIPDIFEVINSMPYTSMGKIDFKLLEKGLNNQETEDTLGVQKVKKRKN